MDKNHTSKSNSKSKVYVMYPLMLLTLIAVTIVAAYLSYNGVVEAFSLTSSNIDNSVRNASGILQISKTLSDLASKNFAIYSTNDLTPEFINEIQNDMLEDLDKIEKAAPMLNCKNSTSPFVQKTFKEFLANLSKLKDRLLKTDNTILINSMQTDLQSLIDYVSSQLQKAKTLTNDYEGFVKRTILISFFLIIAIEVFVVLFILFKAFRPLIALLSSLKTLSNGDFTQSNEIESIKSGIFAQLLFDIVKFKNLMNNSFLKIKRTSERVEEKASKILDNSKVFSDNLNNISKNEDEISNIAFDVQTDSNELLNSTKKSLKITQDTMDSLKDTNSLIERTNKAVSEMLSNSSKLAEIFKFIDQIATQTNILAINASVEASKAGEYGKVFATIAKNIRNLSIQTSKYSENSKELIDSNMKNMQNVKEFSSEVFKSFSNVKDKFFELTKEINFIGEYLPNENQKLRDVSKSISAINGILKEYLKSADSLMMISNDLARESEALASIVDKFKLHEDE